MVNQNEVISFLLNVKKTLDSEGKIKIDNVISLLHSKQKQINEVWSEISRLVSILVDEFNMTIKHLKVELKVENYDDEQWISVVLQLSIKDNKYKFGIFRLTKHEDKIMFNSKQLEPSIKVIRKEIVKVLEKNRSKCEDVYNHFFKEDKE